MCVCVCSVRDTAANDESMATVLYTNLLSQLDRVRANELNFLQRHNMKIIQQQLQVSHLPSVSRCNRKSNAPILRSSPVSASNNRSFLIISCQHLNF